MYLLSTYTTYNSSSEAADLIRFRYHRYLPLVAILNVVLKIFDSKNMLVVDTLCSSIVSLVNNLCWGDSLIETSFRIHRIGHLLQVQAIHSSTLNIHILHLSSHIAYFLFSHFWTGSWTDLFVALPLPSRLPSSAAGRLTCHEINPMLLSKLCSPPHPVRSVLRCV